MLFFLRHGERVDSVKPNHPDYVQPAVVEDPQLTVFGIQQAKTAANKIKQMIGETTPDQVQIVASPFLRCMMTAQEIAKVLDVKSITVDEQLSQVFLKEYFDSCPKDKLVVNFPQVLSKFFTFPFQTVKFAYAQYPEVIEDFRIRTKACSIKYLKSPKKVIILVGHTQTVRTLLGGANQETQEVSHCCLNAMDKDGKIILKFYHPLTRK